MIKPPNRPRQNIPPSPLPPVWTSVLTALLLLYKSYFSTIPVLVYFGWLIIKNYFPVFVLCHKLISQL